MKAEYVLIVGLGLLSLAGCTHVQPERRVELECGMPEEYAMYKDGERTLDKWWQEFGDDNLNALMAQAIDENFSLLQARARLQQARYAAAKAGAAQQPSLDWNGGVKYGRQRSEPFGESNIEEYSLGLGGSYEVDLWGKLDASVRASELDVAATQEDLKTAGITVTGRIAELWIRIVSEQQEQSLLKEQLASNEQILELLEQRAVNTSKTNLVDVLQQRQSVAAIKTAIKPSEMREQAYRFELATLLGKAPNHAMTIPVSFPNLVELPRLGLPAKLLENRPDVVAAGLRMQSSDWRVAVAKADRLPSLRLTGILNFSSGGLTSILDNWIATLASGITGPIFDGGRRKIEVERLRTVTDQLLFAYKETVSNALRDVETALMREQKQFEQLNALAEELKLAEETRKETEVRYLNGAGDYLSAITALLRLQRLQLSEVRAKREIYLYRISLYRALGGGSWKDELVATKEPTQ